jgi:ADP-ribosyl-[dinitrogen reductase] hydrolase
MTTDLKSRFRGALLGLAAGDALGTTAEFEPRGNFRPITDMHGGGPFHLEPGQWTDDTSTALCLAESLIESRGFDAADQMERYLRWHDHGHWSSTGVCFDIGITTRGALQRYRQHRDRPFAGSPDSHSAGNGSLMRLAPLPLYYHGAPAEAIRRAADSSRTTHATPAAVDACRYFAGLLVGALHGDSKENLLAPMYAPPGNAWAAEPLVPEIRQIAEGSFRTKSEQDIEASGYVVHTLEAALWAFSRTSSFRDGALLAVNLGDDADTTGAVYGQLAGAYYGVGAIPTDWLEQLSLRSEIEAMADRLHIASGGRLPAGPEPPEPV